MEEYNISNRELILFLGITFGLTTIMGIAMGLAYTKSSVGSFPLVQMYYPAMGVIITLLLNKKKKKEQPKYFFITYLFFSITSIIYLLLSTFLLHNTSNTHLQTWLAVGSLCLIFAYSQDNKKAIENFGLKIMKNNKSSIINVLLFIVLYLASQFIFVLLTDEISVFIAPFKSIQTYFMLLILVFPFMFGFMVFFGEEYGWRYFLQPALQERFGKRKGVIILGLLWGMWHLPINMFYYSPETSFYSVMNQLIVCIAYSVFFGYVYMKTENIWTVTIIHYINNNLGYALYKGDYTNMILTWEAVLLNLLLLFIIYIPFLLTREYRSYKRLM